LNGEGHSLPEALYAASKSIDIDARISMVRSKLTEQPLNFY